MIHIVSLVLDAIIVIAQYARDQAMGSARDQAAKVSLRLASAPRSPQRAWYKLHAHALIIS